jgi:hypothetical protein
MAIAAVIIRLCGLSEYVYDDARVTLYTVSLLTPSPSNIPLM